MASTAQPPESVTEAGCLTGGHSHQPTTVWIPNRPHTIVPCFRCAQWGHLQKDCPKVSRVYPFSYDVHGDTVYAACTDISSSSSSSCSSSSSSSSNVSSSGSTGATSITIASVSGFNEHNGSVWNQDDLLRPHTHTEYSYRLGDVIDTLDVKRLEPLQGFPLLSDDPLMARC